MEGRKQIEVVVPPVSQYIRSAFEPVLPSKNESGLSFGQALQFTPIVASMLPTHDRIPLPQICRFNENARFTSSTERKRMQELVELCSSDKARLRLSNMLKPEALAEIKFQQSPVDERKHKQNASPNVAYTLSPVARTVMEMTTVHYRFPSFNTITKSDQKFINQQSDLPVLPFGTIKVEPPIKTVGSPRSSTATALSRSDMTDVPRPVLINIPPPALFSTPARATPVQAQVPASELNPNGRSVSVTRNIRSQKETSDAALLDFQNALMEIFEAQDQLDAGSHGVQDLGYFDMVDEDDQSELKLSAKTMDRIQLGLKKLVGLRRLSDVSKDHLRRLQRLCEYSVERVQTLSLRPPADQNAEDEEIWKRSVRFAESGLASASICLYTILGCPHEESLLFTDARIWIPNILTNVFESCIIPIVEARQDGHNSDIFAISFNHRDDLKRLLESAKKLLDTVSTVCAEVKGMDSSVNAIEFLCAKLIFVQNASTDKGSCLGIQIFEKSRKVAMSCLAKLYARFPRERPIITDEILSSLDKLPSNSRSARQYRLANGKNIQLISALFMQLIQTTALDMPEHSEKLKGNARAQSPNDDDDDINTSDEEDTHTKVHRELINGAAEGTMIRLQNKAGRLFDTTARSAHDIVMYLVSRASKTTKTGDSPYRNILDLFIEDLVVVLAEPEWPSSELLLRILARKMIHLANNDKAAAIKNMALESLGVMGSAISMQKALIPNLTATLEREGRMQSDNATRLCELARDYVGGTMRMEDLILIDGPFALVIRQLVADAGQNLRFRSACGYFLAHFAKLISRISTPEIVAESDIENSTIRVSNWLLDLIPEVGSDSVSTISFDGPSSEDTELAYTLCILNTGFCTFFGDIVKTLASSFSSDSALVRSRSLKSVVAMLETDSSLLDRDHTIAEDIFRCASDESALVRDSALSLIARFIISKPGLQQKGIKRLLECASDSKVGVQKRAITHLRDVYLGDSRELLRAKISSTFLQRTADHEETVAELAKKTLTDIWINATTSQLSDPVDPKHKILIESLAMEIVRCVSHDPLEMCPMLQKFLASILASECKTGGKIRKLCAEIVDVLFERTISGAEEQGPLHTLAAFAAANSQLIQPGRLAKLQSYLGNVKSESDLFMFRSVINIYSHVLPDLSATQKPLLADIQASLMKVIPNLGRRNELDPVMTCLRTIDGVLKNTLKLVKFTTSVLKSIKALQHEPVKVLRLLRIGGAIGRCLDLEAYASVFTQELKDFNNDTVAGYMANVFHALTRSDHAFEIRLLAFDSLGAVCQASPVQFNKPQIRATLFSVFKQTDYDGPDAEREQLQLVVLRLFDELYGQRALAKEDLDEANTSSEKQELGKLGGDTRTRDGHSAISMITREVVNYVLQIALSTQGESAFLAARTLSSISHEGLIHPKQSTGAIVALGTSPDSRVAQVAYAAHQLLHQTHESVCQREYMSAVHEAFRYQSKVIGDATGGRPSPYTAKLAACFSIINTSSAKYVKGFLGSLVARVATDVAIQDKESFSVAQMLLARFILQNLAFFEYSKTDELLHTILQLELAYSKNGAEVVQMLENALPRGATIRYHSVNGSEIAADDLQSAAISDLQLGNLALVKRLTPIAATLLLLIETRSYLVRQYGVGRDVRAAISNNKQSKDSGKAPIRVYGITGERIWNKTNTIAASMDSEHSMVTCCRHFLEQMSMDEDVEVEPDGVSRDPPSILAHSDTNGYNRSGTPGVRKRKGSASASNTPVKKVRMRPRKEARRSSSVSSMDDTEANYDP